MPKLRNMLGETGTIEIPVPGDEPLVVVYRRGVMTPRLQIKMLSVQQQLTGGATAAANPDALVFMCEMFSSLIESWNLTDDAGEVLGTDADSLADVDLSILTAILQEIGRAMSPDPLSSGGSSNGSSPKESLELLPTGTAS